MRNNYTKQIKDLVLTEVKDNKLSYEDIYKKYGIPRSTTATWVTRDFNEKKQVSKNNINTDQVVLGLIDSKLDRLLHKFDIILDQFNLNKE